MIDFTIHACVEYDECKGLIYYLKNFLRDGDNIIVTLDKSNTTQRMIDMVKQSGVEYYLHALTTFANTVKFIRDKCKNDTILELCADEVPTIPLLVMCRDIFQQNPTVDAIGIPRINIYSDLTPQRMEEMYVGPRPQDFLLQEPKNEYGWHVWPDYQVRLSRNVSHIEYGEHTHSGHVGFKNVGYLAADPSTSLIHVKSTVKQERMLRLYDKLDGYEE